MGYFLLDALRDMRVSECFFLGTDNLCSRLHRLDQDEIAQLGLGSKAKKKSRIWCRGDLTLRASHSCQAFCAHIVCQEDK